LGIGRLVGGGVGMGRLLGDGGVGWAEALKASSDVTRNALCINFISILII